MLTFQGFKSKSPPPVKEVCQLNIDWSIVCLPSGPTSHPLLETKTSQSKTIIVTFTAVIGLIWNCIIFYFCCQLPSRARVLTVPPWVQSLLLLEGRKRQRATCTLEQLFPELTWVPWVINLVLFFLFSSRLAVDLPFLVSLNY